MNTRVSRLVLFLAISLNVNTVIADNASFENITKAVGLETVGSGEAAWGDFNNDGWTDLYSNALWRNDKGKRFTKIDCPFGGPGIWGDYELTPFDDGAQRLVMAFSRSESASQGVGA